MKKLFLIIAAALIGVAASAQTIGVTGGITGLNGSNIGAFSQYHAGFVANFPVVENVFHIQPELIYKVKGTTFDDTLNGKGKVDMSVGFLEFGMEGQLGLGLDGFRVYGLAEPFIGYNLKDQGWDKSKDPIENLSWSKVEYGLAVGGGVQLLSFLQASVKYFWNMGTVGEDVQRIVSGKEVRNFNGITLSVALLF